jgi:small subunit ribosomal protein S28e
MGKSKPNPTEEKPDKKKVESAAQEPQQSTPAKVVEIIRRTGATGEITQVRCEIMEGREAGRVMRRNIKGPIRLGDVLMLKQTAVEAAEIRQV